jgi:hypothetical protein
VLKNNAEDDIDGRGKKQRGLDFVKLNKRVVYPSIFKFVSNTTNSLENSPV